MSIPARQTSASRCPACEDESKTVLFEAVDRLYHTTDRRFAVVECAGCGLIRLDPMPSPEELKQFYPQSYWWEADDHVGGRLAEIYRRFVLTDHVRFAAHAVEPPGPVLDVGCGGGLFLQDLSRKGFETYGVDVSAEAARICLRRFEIPAAVATLPKLPFRPGRFGLVTMYHVLEHLHDPVGAVLQAWELLRPGGRLVVQTPNAASWQMYLLGEYWSGIDVPRHLINFRDTDLESLLDYCGFTVRRRKYFSLRDNPAGLATSLWPSLEPVARRVRGVKEGRWTGLLKNLLYLALVTAATPAAALEAMAQAGSTIMLEASRQGEA